MSETVEGILKTLEEMGFSKERAQQALTQTGWKGVEPAMEWLLSHPEGEAGAAGGNDDFSDLDKPLAAPEEPPKELTPEEKAEQLKKLEELRIKKRAEREEQEKKDAKEREMRRIDEGKKLAKMRGEVSDQEMKKLAAERKREKMETLAAKERVKAQIEEDKRRRREKEMEEGGESVQAPPAAAAAPAPTPPKRDYNETRLQIRLPDGSALKQIFNSKEPLSAVRLYVQLNRKDGLDGLPKLMTNYPKKVFSEDEYEMSLEMLGLCPSSVLMVTKS